MNHKRKAITASTSALGSYCKQEKTCVNSLVLCRVHTSTICFKIQKFLFIPYPITRICQEYAHGTLSCAATIHRYPRRLYRVRLPILDGWYFKAMSPISLSEITDTSAVFQQDRLDSTASSNFPAKKHTQIRNKTELVQSR
jgi:hypothetical protein